MQRSHWNRWDADLEKRHVAVVDEIGRRAVNISNHVPLLRWKFFRGGRRESEFSLLFDFDFDIFDWFCFRCLKMLMKMKLLFGVVSGEFSGRPVQIWDFCVSWSLFDLFSRRSRSREHSKMVWWSKMTSPLRSFTISIACRLGFRKRGA